ncbi:MAG: gamma carbonic anhydrase family protein [Polyangiaceae bacterium]|nr:gamma carbonic anhydrase family protein [Polyangiaceae bacterium]
MSGIITLETKTPIIAPNVFVAPNAVVIGDVTIGEDSSVWFGCVLRADVGSIVIGRRTNIQDLTCLHMTHGVSNTVIGDDVTVGHRVVLHGCTVEDGALIGMGAILLDGCVIGADSVIAAGALVPPRMVIPPGAMVKGSPAKVVREATAEERAMGRLGAAHYVENAKRYIPLVRQER